MGFLKELFGGRIKKQNKTIEFAQQDADEASKATHVAAYCGTMEYMIPFAQGCGEISLPDEDGNTLLHSATDGWQFKMVEFLILSGADVNAQNNNLDTPLTRLIRDRGNPVVESIVTAQGLTLEEAREETIKLLTGHGADLSIRNSNDGNALHIAANFGDYQALRHLLIRGRDIIDEKTEKGMTALGFAATFDHPDCVRILLNHGADENMVLFDDVTPLRMIYSSEKEEMKSIFRGLRMKAVSREREE